MPENGTYLLTNVGFSSSEEPLLLLQQNDTFITLSPIKKTLTLSFDTSQRFCTGWRDIATGGRSPCPDGQAIDGKYEQCSACQKRTGFNPAFYHATSVSPQQEARNNEPHILYLAYFGPGVIKVGISHAKRGNARLLEQGARMAMILERFSTAHTARHYEAQIAKLPGISETIQLRKKMDLLSVIYDAARAKKELHTAKDIIIDALEVSFDDAVIHTYDHRYFPETQILLAAALSLADRHLISGTCVGQLGSVLFCTQDDTSFFLPLKKYVGYKMALQDKVTPIATPAQQISLF
jgi:hypothetical protein